MSKLDWEWDDVPDSEARSAQQSLADPGATNALMKQVLADAAGAAPQIPPPPDAEVRLPGGLYWEGGLLHHAVVREMTGEDEEELAKVSGARWISTLLERCVTRIGSHTPTPAMVRKLLVGDRDALVIGVRVATFGTDITAHDVGCPHCGDQFDATVDLSSLDEVRLEQNMPGHEYLVGLRRGGQAKVRLPDGAAQEAMLEPVEASLAERNSRMLGTCLLSVTDGWGNESPLTGIELARSLSIADRNKVLKFFADTQPGPRFDQITFEHPACGKEVALPLGVADLFRGE